MLLWLYAGWGAVFLHQGLSGQCARGAHQANRPVEVNSYYPYGGLMAATTTEGTQPYKYSTKELDRENGLDWYDFHARQSLYYCRQNIKRKTASSDNGS